MDKIFLLVLGFLFLRPLIGTISLAAMTAIVLYPIYSRIRRRWFAALLVLLFLSLVLYLAYTSSIFLYSQIMKLVEFYNQLAPEYRAPIVEVSRNLPLRDFAMEVASAIPGFVVRFPVYIFLVYFLLVDGHRLKEFVLKVFPRKGERIARRVWKNANSIINGIFVNAFVFSMFGTAVLYYAGSSNPLLYAIAASFLGILPIIGAWMVYAYASIELFKAGNFGGIALIAVFLVLWYLFGDTYFKLRYRGDLHPAVLLVSAFCGIYFFGFSGFLLGPVIATALEEFLTED